MHTGYPCADNTRPTLRSTSTLSSTMSTTARGIDICGPGLKGGATLEGACLQRQQCNGLGGYPCRPVSVLLEAVNYLSAPATMRPRRCLGPGGEHDSER